MCVCVCGGVGWGVMGGVVGGNGRGRWWVWGRCGVAKVSGWQRNRNGGDAGDDVDADADADADDDAAAAVQQRAICLIRSDHIGGAMVPAARLKYGRPAWLCKRNVK